MSSGAGRGRGWLNVKSHPKSPGLDSGSGSAASPLNEPLSSISLQEERAYSDISNHFSSIINKIKQLSVTDDGIMLNQKMRYIVEHWSKDCENGTEVEKSFDSIHNACLKDADLATKLVHLIASRTFLAQEIHGKNIRLLFIGKLQEDFEDSHKLQSIDAEMFRNSVKMLGEFYKKGRLGNGGRFSFMAFPILQHIEMLLESDNILDLKLLAEQLLLNGASLEEQCPENISEILCRVKTKLCSDILPSADFRLWLLLIVELSNIRFGLLPSKVHQFYQKQFGDSVKGFFKDSWLTLPKQVLPSTTNDSLNSYPNRGYSQIIKLPKKNRFPCPFLEQDASTTDSSTSSGFNSDYHSNNVTENNIMDNVSNKGVISGRPILGVGARLQRNLVKNNDAAEKERDKLQCETWSNKSTNSKEEESSETHCRENVSEKNTQKKEWDRKKSPGKLRKGWEHDDRFETDYS